MDETLPDASTQTPSVFISYRRADTEGHAGRLSDNLKEHFGERVRVFMDFEAIPVGEDFVKVINRAVGACHALIAVIGRQWLTVTDARTGKRRLDNEKDHVRAEIAAALRRGVLVIPVLVQGATMPTEEELPDDLKPLASRNALEVSGARWNYDVQTLVRALEQSLPDRPRPRRRVLGLTLPAGRAAFVIPVVAVLLLAAVAWLAVKLLRPTEAGPQTAGTGTPNVNAAPSPAASPSPASGESPTPTSTPANPTNTNASGGGRADDADLMALSSVFSDAGPGVVRISTTTGSGQKFFSSGFFVSRAGHILTVSYVVGPKEDDAQRATFSVRLGDGSERAATLLHLDPEADLALLKVEGGGYKTIPLADAAPAPNTRIVAIGAVGGGSLVPVFGTIREAPDRRFVGLEYDTAGGAGGIGGGPILDARGRVVAISHSYTPNRLLRQGVRSDTARSYLQARGVTP